MFRFKPKPEKLTREIFTPERYRFLYGSAEHCLALWGRSLLPPEDSTFTSLRQAFEKSLPERWHCSFYYDKEKEKELFFEVWEDNYCDPPYNVYFIPVSILDGVRETFRQILLHFFNLLYVKIGIPELESDYQWDVEMEQLECDPDELGENYLKTLEAYNRKGQVYELIHSIYDTPTLSVSGMREMIRSFSTPEGYQIPFIASMEKGLKLLETDRKLLAHIRRVAVQDADTDDEWNSAVMVEQCFKFIYRWDDPFMASVENDIIERAGNYYWHIIPTNYFILTKEMKKIPTDRFTLPFLTWLDEFIKLLIAYE